MPTAQLVIRGDEYDVTADDVNLELDQQDGTDEDEGDMDGNKTGVVEIMGNVVLFFFLMSPTGAA